MIPRSMIPSVFVSLITLLVLGFSETLSSEPPPSTTKRTASIVTGANGYVAREVVQNLINENDSSFVYCLVRSPRIKEESEYWALKSKHIEVLPYDMLDGGDTIREALTVANEKNDDICVYHIASVFGPSEDHVQTAKDNVKGTVDLLETMSDFENCRLVMTSSMAAVRGTGQKPSNGKFYTEKDWNNLSKLGDNWGSSYQWSKAESEKLAWELAKKHGIPISSICPSFVFGPPSDGKLSSSYSITLVADWVWGRSEVQSRLCVDVRDVAKAIVSAGTRPEAIGQRFIVSKEARVSSQAMAEALKQVCRETGIGEVDKITYDANFQGGAIAVGGQEVEATERLKEFLGITLRPVEETLSDMGRSLLQEQTSGKESFQR